MKSTFDATRNCSKYFKFSDLIQCGETFRKLKPENRPKEQLTIEAMENLASYILDPLVDRFGEIKLTRAFSSRSLTRLIKRGKAPSLDQHAGHELNKYGRLICERGGLAADVKVHSNSRLLANHIVMNLPFDRLYFYGERKPVHVSYGPQHSEAIVVMKRKKDGKNYYPLNRTKDQFLEM